MEFHTIHTGDLTSAYSQLISDGHIHKDDAQAALVEKLAPLCSSLSDYRPSMGASFINQLLGRKSSYRKGFYIYGGVGRGKSMIMDLFFATVPVVNKRRVHFHAFMAQIHRFLHDWRQKNKDKKDRSDGIIAAAEEVARGAWLLCFDELQVTDITDAMIVSRLFEALFHLGVVVIATSNRLPDDLYKDGLQRERFTPFIALIKEKLHICALDSAKDYRLDQLKSMKTMYFSPLGEKADQFLEETFHNLRYDDDIKPCNLMVQGRTLTLDHTSGDLVKTDFSTLCEAALGAQDYAEIAKTFHTVLLANIPQLSAEYRNEAKRFVTLIDELYEHKVKLICTAEAEPESLYKEGTGAFEFKRTVSRLHEMQSERYLKQAHIVDNEVVENGSVTSTT